MRYERDERKCRQNIRKHGFDFVGIETVFSGFTLAFEDRRFNYPEQRFKTLGQWKGCVVSVIHTETADSVRIISLRKATSYEQKTYCAALFNELGAGGIHER